MVEKVAKAKLTFKFKQYDKQGNFIAEYVIDDVIAKNPTFKNLVYIMLLMVTRKVIMVLFL